jgi:hypothetical protein
MQPAGNEPVIDAARHPAKFELMTARRNRIRLFPIACVCCLAVTRAVAQPAPPLHVDGAQIKDPAGQVVILRGVNHHGFVDIPDGAWDPPGKPLYSGMGHWNPAVVQGTLDDFRKLGFNVVRFHTIVDWWKNDPRTFKDRWHSVRYPESYRQMMKDTIRWAGERGLYVIFDFYAMKNTDGKQSGQESVPWPPYNRYPDVVGSEPEFLELWKSVAHELGGCSNVLFELYNEPHGDAKAETAWFAFCQDAITAIRAETANPVIVQWEYCCWVNLDFPPPQNGASTLSWIGQFPLTGSNIIYGVHLYRNSGGGGPGMVHRSRGGLVNLWEPADLRKGLELALLPHTIDTLKKPLLVTEIGAFVKYPNPDELPHELLWFKNTLGLLNEWDIGYVDWAWQSDEQLDHGALHRGVPNQAGQIFLDSLKPSH